MTEHAILIFLSHLKSYPVNLARKIGCREAILWYHLFTTYGGIAFSFREESCYLLGIENGKEVFDKLCHLNYIVASKSMLDFSGNTFELNLNKLISVADPLSEYEHAFLKNDEFRTLLDKWQKLLIDKNRIKSIKELLKLFDDKSLEQSIYALKLATNNGWVSLKFDEERSNQHKGIDGGNSNGGRTRSSSGGAANSKAEGGYKSRKAEEI